MDGRSPPWMSNSSVSRFWFYISVWGRHGYVVMSAAGSCSSSLGSFSFPSSQGDGYFPSTPLVYFLPKALNIWRLNVGLVFRTGEWQPVKRVRELWSEPVTVAQLTRIPHAVSPVSLALRSSGRTRGKHFTHWNTLFDLSLISNLFLRI